MKYHLLDVGLIPIVTNVGDESELIENDKNGFFIPVGKPDEIAKKILQIEKLKSKKTLKKNILEKMHFSSIERSNKIIKSILNNIKKIDEY